MRILIAEDDHASRRFLFKIISQYDNCDITVDGIELLDAFSIAIEEKKPYDLIFLDIMMPKIDGIEALNIIREIERKKGILKEDSVKVIIISALNEKNSVDECFELNCMDYLVKPIDKERLINILHRVKNITK